MIASEIAWNIFYDLVTMFKKTEHVMSLFASRKPYLLHIQSIRFYIVVWVIDTMKDIEGIKTEHQSDWRDNESISGCLTYLSQNKMWHDVSFSCKNNDGKLLHGHRLILSLRSPVFEAMFFGLLADKRDTVDIVDIEHDVFEHIMRYMYTDTCNLDGENVFPILYGARKYCLFGLANACSSFLESSLSCDNVGTIYEHAKMFNMNALVQTCFVFMAHHSSAVSLSTDSTCLSHESLMEFLSNEELSGVEMYHFRLANTWADQKCVSQDMEPTAENKRKVLGDIVTKIRYPMMKAEEFAITVAPTHLLFADEQIKIFLYILTGIKDYINIEKYSFTPRKGICISVDTKHFEGPTNIERSFILQFCCNSNVRLVKLFPLKVSGLENFGWKDVETFEVYSFRTNARTKVQTDNLDESDLISKDIGILFNANEKYNVELTFNRRRIFVPHKEIPSTLAITKNVGPYSCVIWKVPACVELVEFKVVCKGINSKEK